MLFPRDIIRLIDKEIWCHSIKQCNRKYDDYFMESYDKNGSIIHLINHFYFNYRDLSQKLPNRDIHKYDYRIVRVGQLSINY